MKETLIVPSAKISRKVTKVRDFCSIFCLLSFASPAFEFLCLLLFGRFLLSSQAAQRR